jgi:uncharacterized protein
MGRDTYTKAETANYINQHFVAVKVDFDASPQLVAQLQRERAQAVLNLPAGLPLTSFITPDGRLYFGRGTCPLNTREESHRFGRRRTKLSPATQTNQDRRQIISVGG